MTEETLKPGDTGTVNIRVLDRRTTGWMVAMLDKKGEVQATVVVPVECISVTIPPLGKIVGGQS